MIGPCDVLQRFDEAEQRIVEVGVSTVGQSRHGFNRAMPQLPPSWGCVSIHSRDSLGPLHDAIARSSSGIVKRPTISVPFSGTQSNLSIFFYDGLLRRPHEDKESDSRRHESHDRNRDPTNEAVQSDPVVRRH